jgi:small subunit ribosomal protein S10e
MMIIPKANIKLIYQHLLQEGVLVCKKDARAPSHDAIHVPNLQVMKCLQSLKSRGYVTEEFNWQYHYYFLTDDGVVFLRQYLHVPETTVPATHVAKAGSGSGLRRSGGDGERDEREQRGERRQRREGEQGGEYRRSAAPWRKEASATQA